MFFEYDGTRCASIEVQTVIRQSNHRFSFMFAFIYCLVFKFMLMCFAVYGAFLIVQFNLKKG